MVREEVTNNRGNFEIRSVRILQYKSVNFSSVGIFIARNKRWIPCKTGPVQNERKVRRKLGRICKHVGGKMADGVFSI